MRPQPTTGEKSNGLAGWLLAKLRPRLRQPPRLVVLERIALAPRQSLALVEAEGRRLLVATSPEGTPAFYALDGQRCGPGVPQGSTAARSRKPALGPRSARDGVLGSEPVRRVSW